MYAIGKSALLCSERYKCPRGMNVRVWLHKKESKTYQAEVPLARGQRPLQAKGLWPHHKQGPKANQAEIQRHATATTAAMGKRQRRWWEEEAEEDLSVRLSTRLKWDGKVCGQFKQLPILPMKMSQTRLPTDASPDMHLCVSFCIIFCI